MNKLLTITALIEAGTGLLLVTIPSMICSLCLGSSLNTDVGVVVGRVAGVAIFALAIACWFARSEVQKDSAKGMVTALVVHNAGILAIFLYAGIGLGLLGIGYWIIVAVHTVMLVWCILNLLKKTS